MFFLAVREETALAAGRWAVAAAAAGATAEAFAAAGAMVRRGTDATDATAGTARPLMLKPVPA